MIQGAGRRGLKKGHHMELTCQHDHGKLGHRGERDYESPSESRKTHDDVGHLTEKKGKRKVQKLHGDAFLAGLKSIP